LGPIADKIKGGDKMATIIIIRDDQKNDEDLSDEI